MKNITGLAAIGMALLLSACSDKGIESTETTVSESLMNSTATWRANFGAMHRTIRYSPMQTITVDDVQVILTNKDSSTSVSGGTVRLNGIDLNARYGNSGGVTYQNVVLNGSGPDVVPVKFDGSYQHFQVTGGLGFPAIIDSVQSFPNTVSVTSPLVGANVSKSAGCTITWTGTGSTNAHVMVTGKGSNGFGKTVHSTNSLHLTPADLAGLDPGEITVSVSSTSYKGDDAGGIERLLSVTYMDVLTAQLVP